MKRSLLAILIMSIFLLSGCSMIAEMAGEAIYGTIKGSGQKTLDSIARPGMNAIEISVENWYLFHNERIYVYYYDFNDGDVFFSTDLEGKDKRVISNSEDMRYAELQLLHDDWIYYYTTFNQGIKRVHIKTGEIENILDNEYLHFIPDTLKGNKVLVTRSNNVLNYSHTYFATFDLDSNSLLNERELEYINNTHYYSKEYDKIYIVDRDNNYNYTLYENGESIFNYNDIESDNIFPFRTSNYIYILTDNTLVKINPYSYELIEEKKLIGNNLKPYNSARDKWFQYKDGELNPSIQTSEAPLFYKTNSALKANEGIDVFDNQAYLFNEKNMEFEALAKGPEYGTIQEYGDYYVIQGLLETHVIDKKARESAVYKSSHSHIDDGELYIMGFKGDFYYQRSGICDFEVIKVELK